MANEHAKNANEWTAKQHIFMEWLATPSELRTPLTQGALATALGVHESTMSKWTRIPGFQDEVKALITASLKHDYQDIMYALKRKAKSGSFPHIKMCLEMLGYYTEKRVLDVNVLHRIAEQIAEQEGLETAEVMAEVKAILSGAVAR